MNIAFSRWRRALCSAALLSACNAFPDNASIPAAPGAGHPLGVMRGAGTDIDSGDAGPPQPVTYGGGAVISNVKVVPVFWTSGVNSLVKEEIHCFFTAAVQSPYIDWLSEYDTPTQTIGRGSILADVTITPSQTGQNLNDGNIQTELSNQIDKGVLPAPDANTIYMIYFPSGINLTDPSGLQSCVPGNGFCAYHYSYSHNGQPVRYGVFPDYGTGPCNACSSLGTVGTATVASSHELMEAVTDPDPNSGWSNPTAEIGDNCQTEANGNFVPFPGTNYFVQQLWSNARNACFAPTSAGETTTEPPRITSVVPAQGPFPGNTSVTVNGACFAAPHAIVFKDSSNSSATITNATFNQLTVTVPSSPDGVPGVASLDVYNSDGSGPADVTLTYTPSGMLTFDATSGPIQGGTQVNITGGPFPTVFGQVGVTFGGVAAASVECSTTVCTTYTPANNPGKVNVVVSFNGVSQTASGTFQYLGPQITSVTPSSGPISGGTYLTIEAINMTPTSQDTFLAPATVDGVSVGQILCSREGLYDAGCTLTTPALTSLPAHPVDVQITITHTTGLLIPTAINAGDQFTYTALPALTNLSFGGAEVGGATVTGSIMLNGYAPSGGAKVAVALDPSSQTGVVSLPASGFVTVPAGSTSTTFPVTIINPDYTGNITIDATYAGTAVSAALSVTPTPPPKLSPIGQLCSAQTYVETVTLAEPAPSAGLVYVVSDNTAAASVPTSGIPVAAGATTATFNVTVGSPATAQTVHLTATYANIASAPLAFTVLPAAALTMTLPSSTPPLHTVSGTVSLCAAAPAATTVNIASNTIYASPSPTSVSIPAGGMTGTFTVAAAFPAATTVATITATYQGAVATSHLDIVVPPHCPSGEQLCTCSNGSHACFTTSQQCFNFCR
jgi:hypothetical protein